MSKVVPQDVGGLGLPAGRGAGPAEAARITLRAPGFAKNLNTLAYLASERAADALSR